MVAIDLTGKRALVAGVADDRGLGFAIAKALAEAGAEVSVATWPPLLRAFQMWLGRGTLDAAMTLRSGALMRFANVYPFDADYDSLADVPDDVRNHRRYKDYGDFTCAGLAAAVAAAGGVDIVVHSLANGPEVTKPLLQTSRKGYLAAVSTSAYSHVSLVSHLGPIASPGSAFLTLSFLAAERAVPGYGGGMSAAKAALQSDVRTLAYEAGRRWGHRVNALSAGPYASRAAAAIGPIERAIEAAAKVSPLPEPITADEVGATAAFLCSPLARAVTGSVVYVDKGYAVMGATP